MSQLSIGLSYKAVFTYLNYILLRNDSDELRGLVTAMDPHTWQNPTAEQTVVTDYINVVKGIDISKDHLSAIEGFQVMLAYLRKQQGWYQLHDTIAHLEEVFRVKDSPDWMVWNDNWKTTKVD
ncbi:MAG: hypothetical protein K0Q95_1820 [Bacteroidota bacterium]|jgi:hypothetical protein|nr:hypothetical protein [Bacteroidota bacterium]